MSKKVALKLRTYPIVSEAVETGVAYGLMRLWKYHPTDTMTEDQAQERKQVIVDAVLSDLCDVVDFDA